MAKTIVVKQIGSPIRRPAVQRQILVGLGLNKILGTIHPYPTWNESAKYAAGEWKRSHAPEGILKLLEKLHGWRRGKKTNTPRSHYAPDQNPTGPR